MAVEYFLILALCTFVTKVCENPNMCFMNAYGCSPIDRILDIRRFLRILLIGSLCLPKEQSIVPLIPLHSDLKYPLSLQQKNTLNAEIYHGVMDICWCNE